MTEPAATKDRGSPPPADDPLEPERQHYEKALDIDQAPIDTFIYEMGGDFPPSTAPTCDTLKKKLFPSQETPEQEDTTAFTAPTQAGLTPRTLLGATMEQMKQGSTRHLGHLGDDQIRPPAEYPPLSCSSVLDLQRGELGGGVGNGGGSSGGEAEGVK